MDIRVNIPSNESEYILYEHTRQLGNHKVTHRFRRENEKCYVHAKKTYVHIVTVYGVQYGEMTTQQFWVKPDAEHIS